MRRPFCTIFGTFALVVSFAEPQESKPQPQSSETRASSDTTIINLLQQSHDIAQQFAVSRRIELLKRQAEMVSGLRPDLGREWANELSALSSQSKGNNRAFAHNDSLGILARQDPDRVLEILHSMSPEETEGNITTPGLQLATQVFTALVAREGATLLPTLEREAELMGARGPYPYGALGYAAMQATIKDWGRDNQHAIDVLQSVFEPAFVRYSQNPHDFLEDIEFGRMLEAFSGALPFDSVQPALHLLVNNLLAVKIKYEFETEVHTRDGRTAKVDNTIDAALLLFGMLINRDPELTRQLGSTRPELQTALEYAKAGRMAGMSISRRWPEDLAPGDPGEDIRMDALQLSHINTEAAIAKAEQLPGGDKRADTMLQVARDIAGDHPERAGELIAEVQRGNKTIDVGIQLNMISAQAFVAAAQQNKDDLHQLLQGGFDVANHLVLEQQRASHNYSVAGLGPLVQIGIQNDPALTVTFIEGLPASYLKANLLLGAASALSMRTSLPLNSRPQQERENPISNPPLSVLHFVLVR
jgi:hypothetical protein